MTLMLVSKNSDGPLSYGIYVYMQSAAGRGPGAALGIVAVVVVGVCTLISYIFVERRQRKLGLGQTN
ncbi:MAG: iron ABC transporter permease, partial [Planctomycetes bacterium]|nr:iron ABC transporter permease [Planctomycetota bacterium]